MPIRALLLDLDGTLADSLGVMKRAYRSFMARHGLQGTAEEFECLNGPSLREIVRVLGRRYRIPSSLRKLEKEYQDLVRFRYKGKVRRMPGAADLLKRAARRGVQLALVTSSDRRTASAFLKSQCWDRYFTAVTTSERVPASKPSPEIYLATLKRLGLKSSECLAIEDSVSGVRSASGAGVRVLAFFQGDPEQEQARQLLSAGAEGIIGRLTDALDSMYDP